MLRHLRLYTAIVIAVVTAGAIQAEEKAARAKTPITGVDRSSMDPTVSPCKNFYAYANGAFEKMPIPGEYAAQCDQGGQVQDRRPRENRIRAGDAFYGIPFPPIRRQALHASSLGFEQPRTKKWVSLTSELPDDMQELLKFLESHS